MFHRMSTLILRIIGSKITNTISELFQEILNHLMKRMDNLLVNIIAEKEEKVKLYNLLDYLDIQYKLKRLLTFCLRL